MLGSWGAQLFDVPFTAHDAFKGCERSAVCQVEQGVPPTVNSLRR